jgi:hypothetical protein
MLCHRRRTQYLPKPGKSCGLRLGGRFLHVPAQVRRPATGLAADWTADPVMSDERGQSMAGLAVVIRADRKSRAKPNAANKFSSFDPIALAAAP